MSRAALLPPPVPKETLMSIPFPSGEFFCALQDRMNANPDCTKQLDPSEAFCGFAIDDSLFILEFDGRECSTVATSGNELDLDFVVAGPEATWRRAIEGAKASNPDLSLSALVKSGELSVRSFDDEGTSLAGDAMPFLQVFLDQSRDVALESG
jgi:hypothetical protein